MRFQIKNKISAEERENRKKNDLVRKKRVAESRERVALEGRAAYLKNREERRHARIRQRDEDAKKRREWQEELKRLAALPKAPEVFA